MNRTQFCNQPAHLVLVDLASPFDVDVCRSLQQALDNVLTLACALNGPTRIPFFGLYALGNYPEAIIPLQPCRGNHSRLHAGLQELQRTCSELKGSRINSCIAQGLHDAICTFRNQAQSLLQTGSYWSQLDVVIFTCQNMMNITKQVEQGTKDVSLESLKKVQVVCINMPLKHNSVDDMVISQVSDSSRHSSESDLNSLTDYIHVDPDTLSLETYLKNWLHDSTTETEHLHIMMPGDMTLKCDLQDRVLPVASLPSASKLLLQSDGGDIPAPAGGAMSATHTVPVHQLRVIERIPTAAICESVVFGQPGIARATNCWKIDWDELESNSQNMTALCHLLNEKNQMLLAEMVSDGPTVAPISGFRYTVPPPPEPTGHFLLFPSPTNTLLIKSAAVRELMLPCDVTSTDTPTEERLATMDSTLAQVDECEVYNPLTKSCGLYDHLSAQLSKSKMVGSKRKQANFGPAQNQQPRAGGRGGFTAASLMVDDHATGAVHQKRPRNISSDKAFYSKNCNVSGFPTEL